MEGPGYGDASSSGASSKLKLLDLPAESLANIVSYVPRKSLFSLLLVSHQFHQLASAVLYRNLLFNLAETNGPSRHRDPALRLADYLHTILTSSYDYAQHVKFFSLRMVENDADHKQKRIASKFLATEEAGMLLNSALLVMIRRARSLEQFNWQVPIECSSLVYQALSKVPALQSLHLHFDIQSVGKHSPSFYPPPPPPPGPMFGGQTAVWWDPLSNSSLPSSSIPSSGSHSKTSKGALPRSKVQNRKLGAIRGLQSLTITAIDDMACLEEIASCVQASSSSLKTLTISFAESLVSKSQKPNPNNLANTIHMQDDDVTTEPGSPELNANASAPTDLDLKREKQAQEQTLARIFSLDKVSASVRKHDKKVEKLLRQSNRGRKLSKGNSKALDDLAFHILSTIQISKLEPNLKSKVQDLVDAIVPFPVTAQIVLPSKKSKPATGSNKSKWVSSGPSPPMSSGTFGQPSNSMNWSGPADPTNPGSSKAPQPYVGSPDDFEFGTGGAINNLHNNPLISWNSGSSQHGLTSTAPKTTFAYSNSAGYPPPMPKNNLPPTFGLGSSYTYHPNASSSMVNSVSQTIPFNSHSTQTTSQSTHQSDYEKCQWDIKQKFLYLIPHANKAGFKSHMVPNIFAGAPPELIPLVMKLLDNISDEIANAKKPQNQPIFTTKKLENIPAPKIVTESSSESSSDSDSDSGVSMNPARNKSDGNHDILDGAMSDFDMDHPDAAESEAGDAWNEENTDLPAAAENISAADVDASAEDKGKGKQKAEQVETEIPTIEVAQADGAVKDEQEPSASPTLEESIQEYIRSTHGLSIQDFTLCFIPLKSSVIAKALDLTLLRKLVFFNVGSQAAFWTMMEKLIDQGTSFSLQSLYTDDVSAAFVGCLGKLSGLKSLHLLRRSSKEFSCTSSKPPATLTVLHRNGLSNHLETLQSLSITNLEDDSWDVDDKLIKALSSKAKKLRELAFSTDSSSFHTFLRCLPGFKSLIALHVINIKVSPTPSPMMPLNEWKKLILDVLCYYPSMKLKYVGLALINQGRVSQIGEKPKLSISSWYKKQEESQQQPSPTQNPQFDEATSGSNGTPSKSIKGKGKAPLKEPLAKSAAAKSNNNSLAAGITPAMETYDSTDEERPNVYYAKTFRTSALADSYAIYSSLVLRGRL